MQFITQKLTTMCAAKRSRSDARHFHESLLQMFFGLSVVVMEQDVHSAVKMSLAVSHVSDVISKSNAQII